MLLDAEIFFNLNLKNRISLKVLLFVVRIHHIFKGKKIKILKNDACKINQKPVKYVIRLYIYIHF